MAWTAKQNGAGDGGYVITLDDGTVLAAPVGHRLHTEVDRRVALDPAHPDFVTVEPAAPAPPPPTTDEIYDAVILTDRVLKAVVLSLNDGTLAPGANVTGATLKSIIKANM